MKKNKKKSEKLLFYNGLMTIIGAIFFVTGGLVGIKDKATGGVLMLGFLICLGIWIWLMSREAHLRDRGE